MKVYLGIPSYDGRVGSYTMEAIIQASRTGILAAYNVSAFSILTKNFNILYADALNAREDGVTHFAMMHEDIKPEPFWLDKMVALMDEHKADVLSAVVPIKDQRGLTSTALDSSPWQKRRLTMHELYREFPATFTRADLLVNTGLMLVDITKPWAEKLYFEFTDAIIRGEDGKFKAVGIPEDWNFSLRAHANDVKVYATREVRVEHFGRHRYGNHTAWGTLKTDDLA